jgi:methionine-rich copper-binding protein CopC
MNGRSYIRGVVAYRLALVTALMLVMPMHAGAHSSLLESSPAIGATVDRAPSEIKLRFSDPVVVPEEVVSVLDLQGRNHAEPGIRVVDRDVTIPVSDGGIGTRVVAWNAISDHGTEVSGSFVYHIEGVTKGAATGVAAIDGHAAAREINNFMRALAGTAFVLLVAVTMWRVSRRRRSRSAASHSSPWSSDSWSAEATSCRARASRRRPGWSRTCRSARTARRR